MTVIAIVGSRTKDRESYFNCKEKVAKLFESIDTIGDIIVSGGCASGADALARQFCSAKGIQYIEVPAFWYPGNGRGADKAAGVKRNRTIAWVCNEMYAFWDGQSKGTKDAIDKAKGLGKKVTIIPI